MASGDFEPLRIRAYLGAGVVSDPYLPLDGILYYQQCRERMGRQDATRPGMNHTDTGPVGQTMYLQVPLKVIEGVHGQQPHFHSWWYACSFARWSDSFEFEGRWRKRFDLALSDLVDFDGKRGKVIVEQGRYKAYDMPVYYRVARLVEWYAVGNPARIKHLLASVTHIGKKTVQGWGRVLRWEVAPFPQDWSIINADKELMRAIPLADAAKLMAANDMLAFGRANYGLRPSYWDKRNQIEVALPASSKAIKTQAPD